MADACASWDALDRQLVVMTDTFTNLVRATRIADDESDQLSLRGGARKDRVPGDLLEVWTERLVAAGHAAIRHVGELKSQAMFTDFKAMMEGLRRVRDALGVQDKALIAALATLRMNAQGMLADLEDSYYGCPHRGAPPAEDDTTAELKELVAIATEVADASAAGGAEASMDDTTAIGASLPSTTGGAF